MDLYCERKLDGVRCTERAVYMPSVKFALVKRPAMTVKYTGLMVCDKHGRALKVDDLVTPEGRAKLHLEAVKRGALPLGPEVVALIRLK